MRCKIADFQENIFLRKLKKPRLQNVSIAVFLFRIPIMKIITIESFLKLQV